MSLRGRHFLSRMLITFDPRGGSSKGMIKPRLRCQLPLQEVSAAVRSGVKGQGGGAGGPAVGGVNGMHLNDVAKAEHKRYLRRTSELRWRADTTNRIRNRRRNFRMTENPPFVTRNPDEERREFAARLVASDTSAGRARNAAELSHEMPPDRAGDNYNIFSLLTHRGSLKYDPQQMTDYEVKNRERGYRWPAWKVWGPSGKQLTARNLNPKEIQNHLFWLTSTAGQRSSKWGNNIERHRPVRPSIQGTFTIRELAWDEVPEPSDREVSEEEALTAVPFIDRASLSHTSPHNLTQTRHQQPPQSTDNHAVPTEDLEESFEVTPASASDVTLEGADSEQKVVGELRNPVLEEQEAVQGSKFIEGGVEDGVGEGKVKEGSVGSTGDSGTDPDRKQK